MAGRYERNRMIGEHLVELPPLPKNRKDIINIDEKPENAFWRRQEFPDIWYDYNPLTKPFQQDTVYDEEGTLLSLSYDDSETLKKLLLRENHRRKYGVFMKNEDEIVWIAPGYYFLIQWCQMKDLPRKYGEFREIQNDVSILWHHTKFVWDWTIGLVLPKTKKSGISQMIAGDILNDGIQQEGWEMLIMSKEFDHAVDVPMAYIYHSYDNLPYIMKPDEKGRNQHEIHFGTPVARVSTAKVKKVTKKAKVLNTHIKCSKTKPTGFDGPVVRIGYITEMPKAWEASKVSPDVLHKKVRETVKLQQKKNGALIYESYMPEVDDRGFKEFRTICLQSKLSTRKGDSLQTESGMIVFEITALDANEQAYDKYGRCDRRKALKIIEDDYNTLSNDSDKQAHRRQYPRNKNDMYDSGGRGTTFDNAELALQQREVGTEMRTGVSPYTEGHLRWTEAQWETGIQANRRPLKKFSTVYLEPLTEDERIRKVPGSLKEFFSLPDEFLNQPVQRNLRDEDDFLMPVDDLTPMAGSFDPTDYVLKKDVVEGSMFAGHGGFLHDPVLDTRFNGPITNTPIYEYHFRHENPDDDLEMLIKIILYYNARVIIEANKKWVVTAIKREGLQNFLLLKQSDGSIKPYKKGDENKLVNTTQDMINAYVRSIKVWWGQRGVRYMKTMKSLTCLQQCMDFDPNETKKYDLVVSLGYYRLATDSYKVYKMDREEEDGKYDPGAISEAMGSLLNF